MRTIRNHESRALSWDELQGTLGKISYELRFTTSNYKIQQLYRLQLILGIGCYCGLRASDLLKLK